MENPLAYIIECIESRPRFALATIVHTSGSTPGTAGCRMIVYETKEISGTIGGGAVEAEVIQSASGLLKTGGSILRHFQSNTGPQAEMTDMICGGELTVLIETFSENSPISGVYKEVSNEISTGSSCLLLTELSGPDHDLKTRKTLVKSNEEPDGFPEPVETPDPGVIKSMFASKVPFMNRFGTRRFIVEPFFPDKTVLVFGGGHVSRQLANITGMLDFRTVIIDDRPEFANKERFDSADDIRVLNDFSNCFSSFQVDGNSFIVIVTRGHLHDETVLKQALKTDAGYIGMIGSRGKRDTIYRRLYEQGVEPDDIRRVHSPIGLDIAARTPEEIAVSIAAELIKVRNTTEKSL
ncbi:MAG: XdhC/CoxI family protein [Desulfobacteraceae bacterium]